MPPTPESDYSNRFIFYANRYISVKHPYIEDSFVAGHAHDAAPTEIGSLLEASKTILRSNKLLASILEALRSLAGKSAVNVVDIGVFMGSFSNTISLLAKQHSINVSINAFEANPQLILPILQNFRLYDSNVSLHWSGISDLSGRADLVVSSRSTIGASLKTEHHHINGISDIFNIPILSLANALGSPQAPSLVKIDIEGLEVPAFRSIHNNPSQIQNVFIIEFAPSQCNQMISGSLTYSDFLLANYRIYNIGNWSWYSSLTPLETENDLIKADLGNGGFNTDLLLIPKAIELDVSEAFF